MKSLKIPHIWPVLYAALLLSFTFFVLLDTFVIPRAFSSADSGTAGAQTQGSGSDTGGGTGTEAEVTDSSYRDGKISITLTTYREDDTDLYVADITLADAASLKTALAEDTYGRNITETTSAMAAAHGAILAINGDYYGAQNKGYVIRSGTIYRDTVSDPSQQDLVIYEDGSFDLVTEGETTASELLANGAQQVLSFGPGLLEDGEILVTKDEEVGKAMASNPRTAIGMIAPLHYVMVVADGRTDLNSGLSLYQLAAFLQKLGVKTAYNLDGGGSSTLYFNGAVVNNPTTNGRKIQERSVSDIVYLG